MENCKTVIDETNEKVLAQGLMDTVMSEIDYLGKFSGSARENISEAFGRTDGYINIMQDPYGEGYPLTRKKRVHLVPGLTVLVGCNGIGKTAFLKTIRKECIQKHVPFLSYNNLTEGNNNAMQRALHSGNSSLLANLAISSEGERIAITLGNAATSLGRIIHSKFKEAKEIWILFDAVDSGFSADNIVELKEDLFKTILQYEKHRDVYIVVAANEYELARGEKCFDVYEGKYVDIGSYEGYRQFVLKSRELKDLRLQKSR